MPLEVRNQADQSLLHRNEFVAVDFDVPELVEAARDLTVPAGHGHLRHWYCRGIRLGYARWRYHAPTTAAWHADLDVVHLHVNLRGRLALEHRQLGRTLRLANHEHTLFYAPAFHGTMHYEERESEVFIAQFTRPVFLALMGEGGGALAPFAARVAAGEPALLTEQPLPLALPMLRVVRDVLDCSLAPPLKRLYLPAKGQELLALQADALARAAQPPRALRLSEYDREQLRFARDYLVQHAHLPPTLPELARLAGLNECKLKQGFKALFGLPVFAYLSEYRLTEAHHQLTLGRKSVTELAFELGYSSVPHFSTAFRKRFGVAPRELRAN